MNVCRYFLQIVLHIGSEQFGSGVHKIHCAVDAYAHIYIIFFGNADNVLHVGEAVPGRQAEHQGNWNFVFQRFNHLNHFVISVTATHKFVSLFVAVERQIQVRWVETPYHINHFLWQKTVGEQRVFWVVCHKPLHYGVGFGVKHEFSALKSDHCVWGHAFARHEFLDVRKRKVLLRLLPYRAVLAARLASGGGVNHERA